MAPPTPTCPKCAYDQSGEITTWKTKCPLQGQCPECGLTFQWFTVLNPDHTKLPWYTEHAPKLTATFKRTPTTLLRLILPPIFWRRLPVTATITLPMLIKWCIALVLIAHLLASVCSGLGRWQAFDARLYKTFSAVFQNGAMSIIEICFNALFAPLFTISGSAIGTPTIQWGSPYYEFREEYIATITLALGASFLWQIIMTAIPTTRKIAKLRDAHILRATILSMTQIVLVFEMGRAIYGLDMYFFSRNTWALILIIAITLLSFLWQLLFWPSAILATWKIRPAALLIILGSIASLLGAFTTSLLVMNLF